MKQELNSYIKSLQWRYATKEFDPEKKIPNDVLSQLLEVAQLSSSSFGLQVWKFVVVQDPKLREKLLPEAWGQRQIVDASELLILCRPSQFKPEFIDNHIANTAKVQGIPASALDGFKNYLHEWFAKPSWPVDPWLDSQLYIVLGNLLSACAVAGIDSCPMEGFSHEAFDRILGLKEQGLKSVVALPIGFRKDSDKYAHFAKVRYPLSDLVILK